MKRLDRDTVILPPIPILHDTRDTMLYATWVCHRCRRHQSTLINRGTIAFRWYERSRIVRKGLVLPPSPKN